MENWVSNSARTKGINILCFEGFVKSHTQIFAGDDSKTTASTVGRTRITVQDIEWEDDSQMLLKNRGMIRFQHFSNTSFIYKTRKMPKKNSVHIKNSAKHFLSYGYRTDDQILF